jgi:hypothetical protein
MKVRDTAALVALKLALYCLNPRCQRW